MPRSTTTRHIHNPVKITKQWTLYSPVQVNINAMEIGRQLAMHISAGLPETERFGGSKLRSNPLFSGDFAMFHVSQAKTIVQFGPTCPIRPARAPAASPVSATGL